MIIELFGYSHNIVYVLIYIIAFIGNIIILRKKFSKVHVLIITIFIIASISNFYKLPLHYLEILKNPSIATLTHRTRVNITIIIYLYIALKYRGIELKEILMISPIVITNLYVISKCYKVFPVILFEIPINVPIITLRTLFVILTLMISWKMVKNGTNKKI